MDRDVGQHLGNHQQTVSLSGVTLTTYRISAALATVAALFVLVGCGKPSTSAAEPTPNATTGAPTTAAATTPAAPTADPDAPHQMGARVTIDARFVNATVFAYKQPVATGAPRPDGQPGFTWGAADIRVCATKDAPDMTVSNSTWRLTYTDDTLIEASSTGYGSFPKPEYPWGDNSLTAGRCLRGWITFPVPGSKRPAFVAYGPEGQRIPVRWTVR